TAERLGRCGWRARSRTNGSGSSGVRGGASERQRLEPRSASSLRTSLSSTRLERCCLPRCTGTASTSSRLTASARPSAPTSLIARPAIGAPARIGAYATRLHRLGRTGGGTPLDWGRLVSYSSNQDANILLLREPEECGKLSPHQLRILEQQAHAAPSERGVGLGGERQERHGLVATDV